MALSKRTLHEGQNHLFCDDKMSGLRNWLREVCMSANTGRVSISRFSSDTEEQKEALQETVIFCVLEIKQLATDDIPLAHLKQLAISRPHLSRSQNQKGLLLY